MGLPGELLYYEYDLPAGDNESAKRASAAAAQKDYIQLKPRSRRAVCPRKGLEY